MGVVGVTGLFNSLQFGNVNSADYGVFITGEAVYNAPERAVEFVEVPGRNGALVLDQGHWQNIEVTYPASIAGDSQADFRSAISGFRNAVMAQTGYQRLTDTYNPDEYRLATSAAGFEINPVIGGRAGEFEIMFNCMPQRWLLSGETPVTISTSGQVLTNPTLHNSSPLIVAEGYGKIGMNGFEPEIYNSVVGRVQMQEATAGSIGRAVTRNDEWATHTVSYNPALFNTGDKIYVTGLSFSAMMGGQIRRLHDMDIASQSGYDGVTFSLSKPSAWAANVAFPDIQFDVGTSESISFTYTGLWLVEYTDTSGAVVDSAAQTTTNVPGVINITHDASAGTITFEWRLFNVQLYLSTMSGFTGRTYTVTYTLATSGIYGQSTLPTIDGEVYIDTELGEAYVLIDGEATSINNMIAFGSDLPTLAPGDNPITKDSTITSLKITPRWWRL